MARYLSGLCVAGLGLCGGGWLVVAAVAFGGGTRAPGANQVNLATGCALIGVSVAALGCWSVAWRRRMRADGVLADRFGFVSRRQARRNRRELSRNVRWTARMARRDARTARRAERALRGPRPAVQAAGENQAELLSQLQALLGPLLTGIEASSARRPLNGTRPPERAMAAFDGEETW
jgi:hypothetical protein